MTIAISGMTSSGKSSLTSNLHNHFQNSLRLNEFEEDDEMFYTMLKWHLDHKPHATLTFETYIMASHVRNLRQLKDEFENKKMNPEKDFIFLDRFSVEHLIFGEVAFNDIDPEAFEVYQAATSKLISKDALPDYAIFLDLSFESFKERIFERNRKSEIESWDSNEEYWKRLHGLYKVTFERLCKEYNVKYFIVNTDGLKKEQTFEKVLNLIKAEIINKE